MATPTQGDKFKANVIQFLETCTIILEDLKNEGKIPLSKESIGQYRDISVLVSSLDGSDLIKKFVGGTYQYWDKIKAKDHSFFNDNSSTIFGDLSADKLSTLKHIFLNSDDPDTKTVIWDYIHSFIKISIKHIFNLKLVELKVEKDGSSGQPKRIVKLKVVNDYKDVTDIIKVGREWKVELYEGFLS